MVSFGLSFAKALAKPPRSIFPTRAKAAGTWPSALRGGEVPPSDDLRQCARTVNLLRFDPPRDDDLPALRVFGGHELGDRFSRRHPAMMLIVMSDENLFIIRETKVNARKGPFIAALQLAQPLVRDVESRVTGTANTPPGKPVIRRRQRMPLRRIWPTRESNAK